MQGMDACLPPNPATLSVTRCQRIGERTMRKYKVHWREKGNSEWTWADTFQERCKKDFNSAGEVAKEILFNYRDENGRSYFSKSDIDNIEVKVEIAVTDKGIFSVSLERR